MSAGFPESSPHHSVPGQPFPVPEARRHQRFRVINARFIIGVVLVVLAIAGGVQVVSAANNTTGVWSLRTALPRGTKLTQSDLVSVKVKLSDSKRRYVGSGTHVAGKTLTRDLGAGELLPVDALQQRECGSLVSVPVEARHLPSTLLPGDRIDVYGTSGGSDKSKGNTQRLLSSVTVQFVNRPGAAAGSGSWAVGVRIGDDKAQSVVEAIQGDSIDVVIVPDRDKDDADDAPNNCG